MVQYHSNMIPNLAEMTRDLTGLLKRHIPEKNILWEEKHTQALQQIKNALLSKPVLAAPKFDRGFILACDATQFTVAGILQQTDDTGLEKKIGYFSRKLLPRQLSYSVTEKECLAVVLSILHWQQWVWGFPVEIRSDHSCLRYLSSAAKHQSRLARWHIILSNFNLTWTYRKASDHGNADGLSRIEMNE